MSTGINTVINTATNMGRGGKMVTNEEDAKTVASETAPAAGGALGKGGDRSLHKLAEEAAHAAHNATGPEARSYVDVAIAALCNSYAYAQSMAFQEEALNKERWDIVMQAAFCRAVTQIEDSNPAAVREQLSLIKEAVAAFEEADKQTSKNLSQMSHQFKEATKLLEEVKARNEIV